MAATIFQFGRVFGMRMRFGQGEMPEHETQVLAKRFLHGLDFRVLLAAVRTLEIAVLHKHQGCVQRALGVVGRADVGLQLAHGVSAFD
jgi:hypothetical protein